MYIRRVLDGVKAGWREGGGTASTEGGYPEPFGLLEPPAQIFGCCCVIG